MIRVAIIIGSTVGTVAIAAAYAKVITCGIGKGLQMNTTDGGGFLNMFSSYNEKIKRLGRIINLRIRKGEQPEQGIFYGDNGIFVRKAVFERLEVFKEISIMEDYDFSIRLRSAYKISVIKEPKLICSIRRHIKDGFNRTHLKWLLIKKRYLLGISPQKLAAC